MALVSACGFSEPRKFILINETADIDGSFLISTLIGQRIRLQNSAIVLVCCQQNFKYYEACGRKLGYNLTMSVNKRCLVAIEPLRDATDVGDILQRTYEEIGEKLKMFENDGKKSVTIIVDDLTFFTNLGVSESELIGFGMKLQNLTEQSQGVSTSIKIGLSDAFTYLTSNLEDFADVVMRLEKLKSGDFKDIDGKMNIKKFSMQNGLSKLENERNLLYFVGDHNVKLTAPGEFGLK